MISLHCISIRIGSNWIFFGTALIQAYQSPKILIYDCCVLTQAKEVAQPEPQKSTLPCVPASAPTSLGCVAPEMEEIAKLVAQNLLAKECSFFNLNN